MSVANDTPAPAQVAGFDLPKVEAWLGEHVQVLRAPLSWTRLQGGHSNLTYLLEDARGRKAVIRRPPMGEVLPKAHDMSREWALISALGARPCRRRRRLDFAATSASPGRPSM